MRPVSISPSKGKLMLYLPGDVPLELVRVPIGVFQMGSPETERGRWIDEGPVRGVTISRDFYLGRMAVTQRQWLAVMGGWPGSPPSAAFGMGDNYPAYYVAWNDAQDFIAAVTAHLASSGQAPLALRLPSEAEWEYACRAGTQTRFFFGDSLEVGDQAEDGPAGTLPDHRTDYMWYHGNCGIGSDPVATKRPNAFGLYDMSGNVWEWCQDWYGRYASGTQTDPAGPASGSYRVRRGGHWGSDARFCRSANRYYSPPERRGYFIGFRLAATVQETG